MKQLRRSGDAGLTQLELRRFLWNYRDPARAASRACRRLERHGTIVREAEGRTFRWRIS